MAEHQVRRLPVVNGEGILEGIVALSDLIAVAGKPSARSAFRAGPVALCKPSRRDQEPRAEMESVRSAAAGAKTRFKEHEESAAPDTRNRTGTKLVSSILPDL